MKKFGGFCLVLIVILTLTLCACDLIGEGNKQFTISFDTMGGSEIDPITIKEGESITLPDSPSKEGFIFDGWYIDQDLLDEFAETQIIAENITLYAKWVCDHTPVSDDAVEADCENTGLTEGSHCSKCEEVIVEQQVVPAKGHDYGEWIDEVPADCENSGINAYFECSACHKYFDAEYTEIADLVIPAKGHDYGEWIEEVPADCENTGIKAHFECSACHKYFDADYAEIADLVIPAKGHSYGEWIDEVPATCTETGTKAHYECSECNKYFDENKDEKVDLTIECHHYNDEVCEDCGYFKTGLEFSLNGDGESWSVIGIGTFSGTELKIPPVNYDTRPVTSIGDYAFSGCSSLTSVTIPDSVTNIGCGAFSGCSSLESITIPFIGETKDGISNTHFGYIFGAWDCWNNSSYIPGSLKTVVITGGINIGDYAFYNCSSLESITIPDSVTSIGSMSFCDCNSLTSITFEDTSTWYCTGSYTDWENKTGGTEIDVTVSSSNAKYFTSTYLYYYWYKK